MPLAHLLPSPALASFQFDPNSDQFLIIQLIVQLVVGLIFAIVCASLAPGRGRSAVGWFFIGLFFTCVGLIILLLIPNLKLEAEKQRRRDAETRRLREQLKKERQVADQRHEAHSQRLGAHDRAIGVDTAPQAALADSDAPSAAAEDALTTVAAEWFYAVDGERSGPVSGPELRALWLDEKIPDNTIVWREGMADWLPIGEVGDILGDFVMTGDEETDGTTPSGAPQWVTMDGIVEGRIADYAALTKATAALNRLGICRFELGRDGGKFTLMPDNQRVSGKGLDEERQAELLQHLATLAQGASGPVESTLRCAMVFDEVCAETVFRAAVPPPAGPGIEPLTRVRPRRADDVPAEAPPRPPWQQLLQRREVMIALPLLVLAFALTAWTSGLVDRLLSANAQGLTVETGEFGDLLQIDVENDWGNYEVEIRRGPSHPDSAAAWEALATAAANEAARLHAVVVREGQDLYVQLRDDKDRMLAENKVNLRPLVTAADGTATVRLPGRITASRVVLSVTRYEKK